MFELHECSLYSVLQQFIFVSQFIHEIPDFISILVKRHSIRLQLC